MMRRGSSLLVCGVLGLALLAGTGCKAPAGHEAPAAPSFRLETLDRQRVYSQDLRGQVVLLLFWETSCSVCKRQMLDLAPLLSELAPQGVVAYAPCGDPEDRAALAALASSLQPPLPFLLDPGARVAAAYGVRSLPTLALVDRNGRLRGRREGWSPADLRLLRQQLLSLAGEARP